MASIVSYPGTLGENGVQDVYSVLLPSGWTERLVAHDYDTQECYTTDELANLFSTSFDAGEREGVRWPVRDLAMCAFLAGVGLRSSELCNANQDWLRGRGWGDHEMFHVLEKNEIRRLPLSETTVEANARWQAVRENRFGPSTPGEPLFVTHQGKRFNSKTLNYWLNRLQRDAAIRPLPLKAFRRTLALELEGRSVPASVICRLLGITRPDWF